MKAITGPCTAKEGVLPALQQRHAFLRANGCNVKHRMRVVVLTHDVFTRDLPNRIQRHHHRLGKWQRLQHVEQIVQAHARRFTAFALRALVIPGGPGQLALRQDRCVGVQHCQIGLVTNGAEYIMLSGTGNAEQR